MIDKIFLLSGTPGTGKTSIAQYITDNYQLSHISLSETVIQNNLFSEVDEERDTKIVDEDKLAEYLTEYLVSHEGDLPHRRTLCRFGRKRSDSSRNNFTLST